MFTRILVPVDFSNPSIHALAMAASLAKDHGALLIALHVGQHPMLWTAGFTPDPSTVETWMALGQQLLEQNTRSLQEAVTRQVPEGVKVEKQVVEGYAPDVILEHAKGVDLIVMGTHGRTGLDRVLVGSVASRVMREAKVPVMVVK